MARTEPWIGVLPVDKPAGISSHDVVAQVRRALGERRVGHTGTLDPFATGLLLLCMGRATRLAEYLTGLSKRYEAVLRFGTATDTDDPTGRVIATSEAWRDLSNEAIRAALAAEVGARPQQPPAFSAKKVDGERLYEKARRGESVEAEEVDVVIHRLDVHEVTLPDVRFDVEVSSGTYIRAIARDVGARLEVPAHLHALRRTAIGTHRLSAALPFDALEDHERVRGALLSPLAGVAHLPRVELDESSAQALAHGRPVPLPEGAHASDAVAVVLAERLVAIGAVHDGMLRPRKVFA